MVNNDSLDLCIYYQLSLRPNKAGEMWISFKYTCCHAYAVNTFKYKNLKKATTFENVFMIAIIPMKKINDVIFTDNFYYLLYKLRGIKNYNHFFFLNQK